MCTQVENPNIDTVVMAKHKWFFSVCFRISKAEEVLSVRYFTGEGVTEVAKVSL